MAELLAPVGSAEKLKVALRYGADAVYLAGKQFGLRAFSQNFTYDELAEAARLVHSQNKKMYVTFNIFAYDSDFAQAEEYARYLQSIGADGVIVSDLGLIAMIRKVAPRLAVHVSTQANTTNSYAARFYADMGVKRIVLARELSLERIARMRDNLDGKIELEAFVHGAMCMSYSGRCLLSNYLSGRASNRGECVQSCRWEYYITEKTRQGEYMPLQQDERGSYILNSKDMNMLPHLTDLTAVGVTSFKIEGRIKSSYYTACIVNAYRRVMDCLQRGEQPSDELLLEPYKTGHRSFCTGFYYQEAQQYLQSSKPSQTYEMCALVLGGSDGTYLAEQRNRFKTGDTLEILSPSDSFQKTFTVKKMTDEQGFEVLDAKNVQQRLWIDCPYELHEQDILRIRSKDL